MPKGDKTDRRSEVERKAPSRDNDPMEIQSEEYRHAMANRETVAREQARSAERAREKGEPDPRRTIAERHSEGHGRVYQPQEGSSRDRGKDYERRRQAQQEALSQGR